MRSCFGVGAFAGLAMVWLCLSPAALANTFRSGDHAGGVVYDTGLVLTSGGEKKTALLPAPDGPEGVGERMFFEGDRTDFSVRSYSVRYGLPDVEAVHGDVRLTYRYRIPVSEFTFVESQSFLGQGRGTMPGRGGEVLHTVGYGIRLLESDWLQFDIVPGLARSYGEGSIFEDHRQGWIGNIHQHLTLNLAGDLAVRQRLNTFLERTQGDYLSAVINLDLETLLTDRLSFTFSYEVHYDDALSDELELRESRFSTSIGVRF